MSNEQDVQPSKFNINDPEQRKKLNASLNVLTEYLQQIADVRDGLKEAIADVAGSCGLSKKQIRKMAQTKFKGNYTTQLEDEQEFQTLYEVVVEGKLRADSTDEQDSE